MKKQTSNTHYITRATRNVRKSKRIRDDKTVITVHCERRNRLSFVLLIIGTVKNFLHKTNYSYNAAGFFFFYTYMSLILKESDEIKKKKSYFFFFKMRSFPSNYSVERIVVLFKRTPNKLQSPGGEGPYQSFDILTRTDM